MFLISPPVGVTCFRLLFLLYLGFAYKRISLRFIFQRMLMTISMAKERVMTVIVDKKYVQYSMFKILIRKKTCAHDILSYEKIHLAYPINGKTRWIILFEECFC